MFMIQSIINLRTNKWIPSVDNKPKLLNHVKNEAFKRQSTSLAYRSEKRDHRGNHKLLLTRGSENKNCRTYLL